MYDPLHSAKAHKTLSSPICLIPVVYQDASDLYRQIAQELVQRTSSFVTAHVEESATPENLVVFSEASTTKVFLPFGCTYECRDTLHSLLSQNREKEVDWRVHTLPQVGVPRGVFSGLAGVSTWADAQFVRYCLAYAGWGSQYLRFSCGDTQGAVLCDGESVAAPNVTTLQALNTYFGIEPLAQYQHLRRDGELVSNYLISIMCAFIRETIASS